MKWNDFFKLIIGLWLSIFIFSCGPKPTPTPTPATVPVVSVQDVSQTRSTASTTLRFYISSSAASTNNITVDYILADGTAHAPTDYAAATGTITIAANQTFTTLDITISGNALNLRETNKNFTITLSNPKNCTITTATATATIVCDEGTYLPTDNTGYTTPTTYPGLTLVWSDEFSAASLDATAWNQETGNNNGWGNHELENYTGSTKNTFLSNGNLIIEARKESFGGYDYTSGRMTTQNKKTFKFGRIDIRAKLPVAKGMWPALWMLGSNISSVSWPACGEIDIMELIGINPNKIYGTVHWQNLSNAHASIGGNYTLPTGDFSQQFHVFSIIWANNSLKFYVDDNLYFTSTNADLAGANNPFNANQFLLFNVAVGGDWPGSPDTSTIFPQRMFVDYVRVFQ